MKLQYFLCLALASVLPAFSQSPISLSVHFENNALRPNQAELAKLDSLLEGIPKDSLIKAELKAFCDAPGSNAYNRELGNLRIHFIRRKLQAFLADSLILSENYGNSGLEDSLRNDAIRRVDLKLHFKPKPNYGPGVATLLAQLRPKAQTFEISTRTDTALLCGQGTLIYIPKDAFRGARSNKLVRIEVREVRKKSAMILEQLTTTSGSQILASDGMLKIEAYQGSRRLRLREETPLVVSLPQLNTLQNPQLFDGLHNDKQGGLNWLQSTGASFYFFGDGSCGTNLSIRQDCPFFWCRLRNFFRGRIPPKGPGCHWLNGFLREYGVTSIIDLIEVLNEDLPPAERISTAEEALHLVYQKKRRDIEAQMAQGQMSSSGLNDYLFNTGKLGWINIDSFSNYPRNQLITQKIKCPAAERVSLQLVFKNQNSILPPNRKNLNVFSFKDVPKGEPVIAVAIKYLKGKAYLALTEFEIGESVDLNFEPASIEKIKESLKLLDA